MNSEQMSGSPQTWPRATAVEEAGPRLEGMTETVCLTSDERHRRRLVMTTETGLTFLLDLPEARLLREGDRLVLEDGRRIDVRAKPEPLLEVRAPDRGTLLRLAWHLGNRHTPAALEEERLLIRRDHVLAEMIRRLGGETFEVEEAFDPEGGAYGDPHNHGHGHGNEPPHSHGPG
ncbi:urease accessory protein [Afifella marina DSM 2698]|uniref:Urease accessory protein UreE n=2 Tax=Afifella marina TaxID=1080 RepID=A0A1G5MJH6_AFIMA|nr:urease accessory protein [Afifella marina DSM 2698]